MTNELDKAAEQILIEIRNQVTESCKKHPPTFTKRGYNENLNKVYFILDNDLIKVGIASSPAARLNQIKTSRPFAKLLGIINGGRKMESKIHKHLSAWKYGREWFYYTSEVKEIIFGYINGGCNE